MSAHYAYLYSFHILQDAHLHQLITRTKTDWSEEEQEIFDSASPKLFRQSVYTAKTRTFLYAAYSQEDFDELNRGEREGFVVLMDFNNKPNELVRAPSAVKKVCTFRAHAKAAWTPPDGFENHPKFDLTLQNINCECDECIQGHYDDCKVYQEDNDFKELAEQRTERIQQKWTSTAGRRAESGPASRNIDPIDMDASEITEDVIESIDNFRTLQHLCAKLKLGGRGKREVLRQRLLDYVSDPSRHPPPSHNQGHQINVENEDDDLTRIIYDDSADDRLDEEENEDNWAESYVNEPVAKEVDGVIYVGKVEVAGWHGNNRAWKVKYDEDIVEYHDKSVGNEEDLNLKELEDAIDLYVEKGRYV